jgi:hypothetical protein
LSDNSIEPTGSMDESDQSSMSVEVLGESSTDPQHAAWVLGISLSAALLGDEISVRHESVSTQFEIAQRAANSLGLMPLEPPPVGQSIEGNSRQSLSRAISIGRLVARDLAAKYDGQIVALFELAFKSNLLRTDYAQRAPLIAATSAALQSSAEKSKLPPHIWRQPLEALSDQTTASITARTATSLQEAVTGFLTEGKLDPSTSPND